MQPQSEHEHRVSLWWKWVAALCLGLVVTFICLDLFGCQNNPITVAKTPLQRAYAAYGEFVILEEQAAHLTQDPTTPRQIKNIIATADSRAKPSADALLSAVLDYESASKSLSTGTGTPEKLAITESNLEHWLTQANTDITVLVSAVKGAAPHE